jgi:hypothetical protein
MEAELARISSRMYTNYIFPTLDEVKSATFRALVRLFTEQCGKVSPGITPDCVAVHPNPATDLGAGGKYVDYVQANSYVSDDFLATVNPGTTDLLAIRLKPDTVAMAIAGFAIEVDESLRTGLPVARINVYQDLAKQKPVATVNAELAVTHMDYPFAYVLMPNAIVVAPGQELVIELVSDARLTESGQYVVMWLPPVVLTSRRRVAYV